MNESATSHPSALARVAARLPARLLCAHGSPAVPVYSHYTDELIGVTVCDESHGDVYGTYACEPMPRPLVPAPARSAVAR